MEKMKAYVYEPTFLSPTDIHFRMLVDEQKSFSLSELKVLRQELENYNNKTKENIKKSR